AALLVGNGDDVTHVGLLDSTVAGRAYHNGTAAQGGNFLGKVPLESPIKQTKALTKGIQSLTVQRN
ncbi:MAG: hypothetical protein B6D69_00485, partial [gamma proteobacterium symbiont of Stewartia floridana]